MQHLMVKVVSPDYNTWRRAFDSTESGRQQAGITEGHVFRDTNNPNAVLVHFVCEDLGRAMQFFQTPYFREVDAASGATSREFFTADKR